MSSAPQPNPCRKPLECLTRGSDKSLILWTASAILVPISLTVFSTLLSLSISGAQRVSTLEAEMRDLKAALTRIEHTLDVWMERHK
jgi:hypothetical protein